MAPNILFIAGTRPEVIEARKIYPEVTLLLTGQHKTMARQALEAFGLQADVELDVMRAGASLPEPLADGVRRILVTTHRRESWNTDIARICEAIRILADTCPDVEFLLPVHKNPVVADQVHAILGGHDRIRLTDPLDYLDLQAALAGSYLTLTDSGGIQEEAPSYGVPALVLRRVTERPEAVNAGLAKVVGTDRDSIVKECRLLLDDPEQYKQMARADNPFGDGLAGRRVAIALKRFLENKKPLLADIGEFNYQG